MITNSPSSIFLREYEEIFTGTNQQNGHIMPVFGYDSSTTEQILKKDNITYFHYPSAAPIVPLSSTSLIVDGAIASNIPFSSDKIWKKQANYQKYIWFGNSSDPQMGTWLCAWLSGSPSNSESIWMDRWYNPGYLSGAMPAYYTSPSAVYDEPSKLTFEPGVWYKYHHIGDKDNKSIVDILTSSNTVSSSLLVYISGNEYPIVDNSVYNNTIASYNIQSPDIQNIDITNTNKCIHLDGNQYIEVLYNDNVNIKENLTTSIWTKVHDWYNTRGSQIIGRSLRGGWSLRIDNGFQTPILSFANRNDGIMVIGNNNANIIYTKELPGISMPENCAIDQELYTWIIDNSVYNGYKYLYKMDYDGSIEVAVPLVSSSTLVDVVIDEDNNVWALDTTTGYASGFDKSGNYLSRIAKTGNNLDINSQNILSAKDCIDMCFDNHDSLYHITSAGLYKDDNLIYSDLYLYRIKCDRDNNLWMTRQPNSFIKIDSTGTILLSGNINTQSLSACELCLTNEFNAKTAQYEDYVWFATLSDKVYKYDMNGNFIDSINLASFNTYATNKDFTGYEWHRKFNYLKYNATPHIKAELYIGTDTAAVCGCQTLSFPVSSFNNDEWHHFAIIYDTDRISLIVDAVERDYINVSAGYNIFYNYENSISIGADSGKTTSLMKQFNINSAYFNGFIGDARIYDKALNRDNIWNIMMQRYPFNDLNWNMPTGSRSYLEEVERFFKFKLPGSKSQYYNIKLSGLQISDINVRLMIEDIIKQNIKKITPMHAELYKIIWE